MSAMFMENVRPLCKLQLIAAKILVGSYCWCPVTKQNVPTLSVICDILSFRPMTHHSDIMLPTCCIIWQFLNTAFLLKLLLLTYILRAQLNKIQLFTYKWTFCRNISDCGLSSFLFITTSGLVFNKWTKNPANGRSTLFTVNVSDRLLTLWMTSMRPVKYTGTMSFMDRQCPEIRNSRHASLTLYRRYFQKEK